MYDLKWSAREKRIARSVFDLALTGELSEIMSEFKARAAAAVEPHDMWSIEGYLKDKRRAIDGKYDYRYSQLPLLFGQLLREQRIRIEQLDGLSGEKLAYIREIASLRREA